MGYLPTDTPMDIVDFTPPARPIRIRQSNGSERSVVHGSGLSGFSAVIPGTSPALTQPLIINSHIHL